MFQKYTTVGISFSLSLSRLSLHVLYLRILITKVLGVHNFECRNGSQSYRHRSGNMHTVESYVGSRFQNRSKMHEQTGPVGLLKRARHRVRSRDHGVTCVYNLAIPPASSRVTEFAVHVPCRPFIGYLFLLVSN